MSDVLNCYSFVFEKNGRVTSRKGIPCENMWHNMLLVNGLGRFRIFICPLSIEDGWTDETLKNAFAHYEGKYPWLGQESDERMYLYSMGISRNNLYLHPYDQEEHVDYVYIEAPANQNLRVLGTSSSNTVLFRRFEGEKQYAMIALRNWGMIRYSDDRMDIMLEYLGEGEFVFR